MDDEYSDKARQLEGLRLMRAFRRIKDADHRAQVIDLAERLMQETADAAVSDISAPFSRLPEGTPGDVPN